MDLALAEAGGWVQFAGWAFATFLGFGLGAAAHAAYTHHFGRRALMAAFDRQTDRLRAVLAAALIREGIDSATALTVAGLVYPPSPFPIDLPDHTEVPHG